MAVTCDHDQVCICALGCCQNTRTRFGVTTPIIEIVRQSCLCRGNALPHIAYRAFRRKFGHPIHGGFRGVTIPHVRSGSKQGPSRLVTHHGPREPCFLFGSKHRHGGIAPRAITKFGKCLCRIASARQFSIGIWLRTGNLPRIRAVISCKVADCIFFPRLFADGQPFAPYLHRCVAA